MDPVDDDRLKAGTKTGEEPVSRSEEAETHRSLDSMPTVAGRSGGGRRQAFQPGEILAERFRVERFIGRGGMGEVYEAFDLELEGPVALKTILPVHALDDLLVERFKREIQLSRKVTHHNVCRIFDLFRHRPRSESEDGREVLFLTMEYLEGETLDRRLRRGGALSIEETLPLARQMAAALDAAHGAGIIHRDFKSANVMLLPGTDGLLVKVTDFGLARTFDLDEPMGRTLTGVGNLVGTPAYMAPEQVRGGDVTAAADIYAFGVVLFEMVTGRRPFAGDTPLSTAVKRLEEPPPSPAAMVSGLPRRWEATILRCLEKDPSRRYRRAGEAVDELAGRGGKTVRRRRWRPAAAALALVLAGAAAWVVVERGREESGISVPGPEVVAARPSVAVLGFDNLSEREELSWIATALSEMVDTEVGVDGALRTVSQETIARVRRDRGIERGAGSAEGAEALGDLLADFVVLGGYTAVGHGSEIRLRIDARVIDVSGGATVATLAETGPVEELFDVVARLGEGLRTAMGIGGRKAAASARGAVPADLEAARLYSEGLAALRSYDALRARDLLTEVVDRAPDFAPAWVALASAWSALGSDLKAGEAADRAMALSGELDKETRLEVEALVRATHWDREGELAIRRTLFTFYSDNPEYGLALAGTQLEAGKADEALATLAEIRRLPGAAAEDPRVDLAEAEARDALGELEEVVKIADRVIARAEAESAPLLAARALLARGRALGGLGRIDEGEAALKEAEARYRTAGDLRGTAQACNALGGLVVSAGRPARGLEYFEEAMESYRRVGDRRGEARALGNIGVVYRRTGRNDEARSAFEHSAATCSEIGDLGCEGRAYLNLGNLAHRQGDGAAARRDLERALELFRQGGNRSDEAQVLSNLAVISAAEGDLGAAEASYEAALATFRRIGNIEKISMVLNNLAIVLRDRGDRTAARSAWEEALELKDAAGDLRGASIVRLNLGMTEFNSGDPRGAVERYLRAVDDLRRLGDLGVLAEGLAVLVEARIATDDFGAAEKAAEELSVLCENLDAAPCRVRVTALWALLDRERGGVPGLVERLRAAAEGLQGRGFPEVEVAVRAGLIGELVEAGRVAEAETEVQRILALAESGENRWIRHVAAAAEARVLAATGDVEGAKDRLGGVIRDAARSGLVRSDLRARLELARLEIGRSRGAGHEAMIEDLVSEAERRGFLLVAKKARELQAGGGATADRVPGAAS